MKNTISPEVVELYVKLLQNNDKEIGDVPLKYRAEVEKALREKEEVSE